MYRIDNLVLALLLLTGFSGNGVAEAFLPPEEAFPQSVEVIGAGQVRASWEVAEGYYLYREKFAFSTETPGVTLGPPSIPRGEAHHDEFFGEVESLRGRVEVTIPLLREAGSGDQLVLETRSQGCADAGLCYPPHRERFTLTLPPLPPTPPAAQQRSPAQVLEAFGRSTGMVQEEEELLPAELAFRFESQLADPQTLVLDWQIAPATYLYRDELKITLVEGEGITLGDYLLPPPLMKQDGVRPDGSFGEVAVYTEDFRLLLPLQHTTPEAKSIVLEVASQGCAEIGICYPPQRQRLELELPAPTQLATAAPTAAPPSAAPSSGAAAGERVAEQDRIAAILSGSSTFWVLLTFFGFGLLLALTPCVFPMIPILSGIIAGQKNLTPYRGFILSLVYVLAMAMTYAVAGILAAAFGQNLQIATQDPWFIVPFALIFIALAFSMFGFYELQLPSRWQSKIADISNRQRGGSLTGVAVMGFLSALIVGPCVAPPLAGALIYVSQTQNWVLGGSALFVMALGMGVPLLLIGASAGRLLPRAGMWMDAIKAVFGVGLLAVAILMLERILSPALAMLLWGMLLIVSGVYMGALKQLSEELSGWHTLWKGLGLVLVIYGTLMLVGAAAGGRDTMQPLRGIFAGAAAPGQATAQLAFTPVKSLADVEREVAAAAARGQPVMLDFYADWCVVCKEMERSTFSDPRVVQALQGFVLLKADVTANDAEDRELLQGHFGLPGPPVIAFYGPDGVERRNYRLVGFLEAERFASHAREAVQ